MEFPVREELRLAADTADGTPAAVVVDAAGRELAQFDPGIDAVVAEVAEADVLARASALVRELNERREAGRLTIRASHGETASPERPVLSHGWRPRLGEFLVLLMIAAILGSIGLVLDYVVRSNAYEALVAAELQTLVSHQELYHATTGSYAGKPEDIPTFRQSEGVSVTISEVTPDGYRADGQYKSAECTLSVGPNPVNGIACKEN